MNRPDSRSGFSLVEVLVALVILALALGGAIAGWLYVLRGERLNSIQHNLDIDVRKSLERVKATLRLSSMDKIHFYPEGVGPFTAISFPLARDDDGNGLVEMDADDKIIWDQTIIYHVWQSTPHQLRMTVFDPRDNSLTPAQRQQQLASVVQAGNGSSALNGANATTTVLFENLFNWKIHGKGAVFDGYSADLSRMLNVNLGSILLSAGSHDFTFSVVGKNPLSSSYKIGLDTLMVSPSALGREGEVQSVVAQSGATAAADYRSAGSWSGNYQMLFPATAVGQYFTLSMENDRWEETNFRASGVSHENTIVTFDTSLTPKDFVVRLQPPDNTWYATSQTLDLTGGSTTNEALKGAAIRVLVRGKTMMEGGPIKNNGPLHCIWFFAASSARMNIVSAYIAEAADHLNYTPDAEPGTEKQLFFGGSFSPGVNIEAGGYAQGLLAPGQSLDIDKEKSYLVSFMVTSSSSGHNDGRYWTEKHTGTISNPAPPGCYFIPGSAAPPVSMVSTPVWSGDPNLQVHTRLYGVERLHLLAPSNGVFTSQIADTKLAAPAYQNITWNSIKPSGTTLGLKVRTGDYEDLSDAPAWSNVTALTAPGGISPGNKRFVQFQALMTSGNSGWNVPSLRDVTIRWTGEQRVTDIGGTMTTGPDYGIYELKVDNKPLIKGVTIDLKIFADVLSIGGGSSNRLTSTSTIEVEPRNTGK